LVGGLCYPQQSFSRAAEVRLESSLEGEKKPLKMMKVGQQGEATDLMVLSRQREERNHVLGEEGDKC